MEHRTPDDEDPDLAFVDAIQAESAAPAPGRPNPEPDPPEEPAPSDEPGDETEREERKPGRDGGVSSARP